MRRFPSDVELILAQLDGVVLDAYARAFELSAAGFCVQTQIPLHKGQAVRFELMMPDGEVVRGQAKIAWTSRERWEGRAAGAKITKISWRDSAKLRRYLYRPGYDFAGLARRMFWAICCLIVAAALHNVLLHQPATRELLWKLAPVIAALIVLGASLLALRP